MLPGFEGALLADWERHSRSCCSFGSIVRSLLLDFYRNFVRFVSTLLELAVGDGRKASFGLFVRVV